LPIAVGEVAGGVIGNRLYLLGDGTAETLVYDIPSGQWLDDAAAARPFAGDHHAAEVLDGKLYLIGGLGASAGRLQVYDPATNQWTQRAAMPFSAGSSATAVIGGQIYVAGGVVGSTAGNTAGTGSTAQAARYNPATDAWSALPSMPRGVNHAASSTDGQRLFVFGGRGGKNDTSNGFNTVQVFDPATNAWRSSDVAGSGLAPFLQARGGMGKAVFANGEFYVIGGETRDGPGANAFHTYDRVDVYNPASNTWRRGPDMPTARHGIFPLLHGDRIYVAGGGPRSMQVNFNVSDILEILDLS
jgi:N-acetylneuraminic acid mutarotase